MKQSSLARACAGLVALATVAAIPASAADRYDLDAAHAWVGFRVQHFGLVDMVCGMTGVKGTIRHDPEDAGKSKVEVEIDAGSLDCGFAPRTDAVKSEAFLHVEKYPTIGFVSDEVEATADGGVARGRLTVHGVTRKVELPFRLLGPLADPWGSQRLGITAELTIDRTDYGITFDRKMKAGTPFVGDAVKIELSVEATRTAADGD